MEGGGEGVVGREVGTAKFHVFSRGNFFFAIFSQQSWKVFYFGCCIKM